MFPPCFSTTMRQRQIQPEAGAFAERLGGEERREDAADDVLGDAGAVVADLHPDHLSFSRAVRIVSVPCPSMAWIAL